MNAVPASAPTVGMECPVCNELFNAAAPARKPRLLACAHTFCTECVGRFKVKDKVITYVSMNASCSRDTGCADVGDWNNLRCVTVRTRSYLTLFILVDHSNFATHRSSVLQCIILLRVAYASCVPGAPHAARTPRSSAPPPSR